MLLQGKQLPGRAALGLRGCGWHVPRVPLLPQVSCRSLVAQQPLRRHIVRSSSALPRSLADVLKAPRPPFSFLTGEAPLALCPCAAEGLASGRACGASTCILCLLPVLVPVRFLQGTRPASTSLCSCPDESSPRLTLGFPSCSGV